MSIRGDILNLIGVAALAGAVEKSAYSMSLGLNSGMGGDQSGSVGSENAPTEELTHG